MTSFYARQQGLFSPEEWARLKAATVLVVGLGGLGSFVAEGLCRAGLGGLFLLDHDRVSISDLNRQILYTSDDIGRFKAQVAKERLQKIREDLWVEAWVQRLGPQFVIPAKVSLVVDALDNWESRFVLDELTFKTKKYLVHAGLKGRFGQVLTFPPSPPRLKDILVGVEEEPSPPAAFPICAILGGLVVEEVLKIICGKEGVLAHKMLLVDLQNYDFEIVPLAK